MFIQLDGKSIVGIKVMVPQFYREVIEIIDCYKSIDNLELSEEVKASIKDGLFKNIIEYCNDGICMFIHKYSNNLQK